jgi:hypothetical protein
MRIGDGCIFVLAFFLVLRTLNKKKIVENFGTFIIVVVSLPFVFGLPLLYF